MSDDINFLREVDEAVRQERYKRLWDKYGFYAIGAAVVLISGVAGYQAWSFWKSQQAQNAGAEFVRALSVQAEDSPEARQTFAELAAQGPTGYRVLSRLQLAAAEAKAGETAKAVALYDELAQDGRVDPILQGYARIQAATLRLDEADSAEIEQRVGEIAAGDGYWRYSARELLGLAAYRAKNQAEAEKHFSRLVGDPGTPQNLRRRAEVLLALIIGSPQALSATTD
jgi:hypothetical protein